MVGAGESTDAPTPAPDSVSGMFISTVLSTIIAVSPTRRVLTDETGLTAAEFYKRAHTWFAQRGVTIERVLTDNGGCYRSSFWFKAMRTTGTRHKRTRPYRPQTNGKVERFHRTLLEE